MWFMFMHSDIVRRFERPLRFRRERPARRTIDTERVPNPVRGVRRMVIVLVWEINNGRVSRGFTVLV